LTTSQDDASERAIDFDFVKNFYLKLKETFKVMFKRICIY